MSIDDISVARVRNAENNMDISPVDLLKSIIHDIEAGDLSPDSLVVLSVKVDEKGDWLESNRYCCGCSREREVAMRAVAQQKLISKWSGG